MDNDTAEETAMAEHITVSVDPDVADVYRSASDDDRRKQRLLTGKTRLPKFGGEWETKRIGDLLTYERPDRYIVQHGKYVERGDVPVLTANKSFVLGYTNETFGVCVDFPVIIFDDFTADCKYVTFPFKVKSSAIKLLRPKNGVDLRYMFELMQLIDFPVSDHRRYY